VSRESRHFLDDIVERGERIADYLDGVDFDRFALDTRTADAVERNLQVIGDAVKAIPADIQAMAPDVPWSLLARFRDVVTHAYFRLDPAELWNVATVEMPEIVIAVRRLRAALDETD
jgi:uncharacterized protein with HEPN domain